MTTEPQDASLRTVAWRAKLLASEPPRIAYDSVSPQEIVLEPEVDFFLPTRPGEDLSDQLAGELARMKSALFIVGDRGRSCVLARVPTFAEWAMLKFICSPSYSSPAAYLTAQNEWGRF